MVTPGTRRTKLELSNGGRRNKNWKKKKYKEKDKDKQNREEEHRKKTRNVERISQRYRGIYNLCP
jgi:hypothetical protein